MGLVEYIEKFPEEVRNRFRLQLAKELGVSREAIRSWEIGIRKPSIKNVLKMEIASKGILNRYDLRPDIWFED